MIQLRIKRAVALLLVSALAAAGCSNSSGEIGAPIEINPSEAIESATTTTTSVDTTTTESVPKSELDDLRVLWAELWSASGLVPEERPAAIAELGDGVDPAVAEGIPNMVRELTEREVFTSPVFSRVSTGPADIRDCILFVPDTFGAVPHYHTGHAIPDGNGGWIIDAIKRESIGCVPAAMADQILEDYDEYWTTGNEYANPPDPDHPGIDKTMTGAYRDLIRERVGEFRADGHRFVGGGSEHHPEITEIYSDTRVVVKDCVLTNPEDGIFDSDGNRVVRAAEPGEVTLYEIEMTLEGGQWKTERVDLVVDAECQFAPTAAGLPHI